MPSDFGAPVASSVDVSPQKGLETIKSLMGLKSQQLTIQGQQSQNQSLQADAQKDQQAMQERQAFQKMMQAGKDDQGNNILKSNGEPDEAKILPAIGRLMPLTGQGVAQSIIKTVSDKVGLQSASTNLDANQRQLLSGLAASNIGNPKSNSQTFSADVDNLVTQHPEMANAASYAKSLAANIDNIRDPKVKDKMWQHLQSKMQPPSELATAQQPNVQTYQAPGGQGFVQTNPRAPGGVGTVGAPVQQGIQPGAMVLSDASGKQFIYDPQSRGLSLVGGGSPGAGTAPGAPPAQTAGPPQGASTPLGPAPPGAHSPPPSAANQSGFTQPGYPGWGKDIEANQGEIRGIRAAGDQAPVARSINQQILRLSQDTNTGPLVAWAREHGLGGVNGDDYQELGKFLEKNAINNMQSMGGPPSDARLSASAAANGSTHFNPGALQAVTKFNDATTTGIDQYRQGVDKAVGTGNNVDYTKLPTFKAAWAKNFDVDVFRVENALRDGDKKELDKIKRERGAEGMAILKQKSDALRQLQNGIIPRE